MSTSMEGLLKRMADARGTAEPEPAPEPEPGIPAEDPILSVEPEESLPDSISEEIPTEPSDPPGEEPLSLSTLSDVSEALGVPVDELYKISVPVSRDGQRIDVPLGEWKDAYQASQDLRAKEAKLESELAQRQQQLQDQAQRWASDIERAEAVALAVNDAILSEEKSINWKQLREEDPQEYVLKRQELQDRKAQLEANVSAINKQKEEAERRYREEIESRQRSYLAEQREALYKALPDWRDPDKAKAEQTKITRFLRDSGFTDQEIGSVVDHRHLLLIRDAMRYRDVQAKAKQTRKGEKAKTPVIKPGARSTRKGSADEKIDGLRAKLKKTGSVRDAASLYAAMKGRS